MSYYLYQPTLHPKKIPGVIKPRTVCTWWFFLFKMLTVGDLPGSVFVFLYIFCTFCYVYIDIPVYIIHRINFTRFLIRYT